MAKGKGRLVMTCSGRPLGAPELRPEVGLPVQGHQREPLEVKEGRMWA